MVSPAHGRRTVAVAGSTVGRKPWSSSAYGSAVDWAAPSQHILRAEGEASGGSSYRADGDGTSYGTAITSGAAALWLAHHGAELATAYPAPWQRVEAFKASATPMPHQQPGSFGAGVLNIAGLLQQPLPAAATLQQEAPA